MNGPVSVFSLQPAPKITGQWLGRMLAPAAAACRFEKVPAVNLLQMTAEGGGAIGGSFNPHKPDSVALSFRCAFVSPKKIEATYLHECAHLVLCNAVSRAGETMDAHGPAFLLTVMTLYQRLDNARKPKGPLLHSISFYDFQDCPPFLQRLEEHQWRPLMLSFAFKHYKRLAASDLSAEAIGEEARRLWMKEDGRELYRIDQDLLQVNTALSAAQKRISELEHFSSPAVLYTAVIVGCFASAALSVMATLAIL